MSELHAELFILGIAWTISFSFAGALAYVGDRLAKKWSGK